MLAVWREHAADVRGHAIDSGHFIPEERPDETCRALRDFFAAAGHRLARGLSGKSAAAASGKPDRRITCRGQGSPEPCSVGLSEATSSRLDLSPFGRT